MRIFKLVLFIYFNYIDTEYYFIIKHFVINFKQLSSNIIPLEDIHRLLITYLLTVKKLL